MKVQSLLFLILISVNSCHYNSEEQIAEDCLEAISYINTIKPIIENNCLSCHSGDQSPNLSTFSMFKANAEKIKEEVVARRMPKNGTLTAVEINTIKCWIENGSLNN